MTTSPLPPLTPSQPSASLYVGDLPTSVSEANLFEIFSNVGHIASIRVCRDHLTKRSLGYAYVNFLQAKDAERALDTLNNTSIKGRPCRIMWCQRDPSVRKSGVGNIFIKNLDLSFGHKELYDTFSAFGNILSCKVAFDEHGRSKGFGFVHFENQESANKAIEFVNDRLILNRRVYVGNFESKKERNVHKESSWTNVYIKDLGTDVTEEDLLKAFQIYGPITSVSIMKGPDGVSKGFGFVNFEEHEHAIRAVNDSNESGIFLGKEEKTIWCGRAQKKSERASELKTKFKQLQMDQYNKYNGVNLYIKNLDDEVKEEELRSAFSAFGNIRSIKIMTDDKNNSKGFGFICYSTSEEAQRAIAEMNSRALPGYQKPLFITFHEPKDIRRQKLAAQESFPRKQNIRPPTMVQHVYPPPPYSYPAPNPGPQYMYPPPMVRQPQARAGWTYPPTTTQPLAPYPAHPQQHAHQSRPNTRNPGSSAQRGKPNPDSAGRRGQMTDINHEQLSMLSPAQRRIYIGEKLYAGISKIEPKLAPKITGMLLETDWDVEELYSLVTNESELIKKIKEALDVLNEADSRNPV